MFANTVHYRERGDDHGTTSYLSTSDFLVDHLAAPAALSVVFHFNPHVGIALHGNRAAPLTMIAAANHRRNFMKHTMSLGDVSRLLNIRPHRLEYAIANRLVRETAERVGGHRVFTPADVRRLAAHFGIKLPAAAAAAEPVEA